MAEPVRSERSPDIDEGGPAVSDRVETIAELRAGWRQQARVRDSRHRPSLGCVESLAIAEFVSGMDLHVSSAFQEMTLTWASDVHDGVQSGKDAPTCWVLWLLDIRAGMPNPVIINHGKPPALCRLTGRFRCKAGDRFGAHNLHPNFHVAVLQMRLANTELVGHINLNGGVCLFRAVESPSGLPYAPPHVAEIGRLHPVYCRTKNPSPSTRSRSIHAIVDERGLIDAERSLHRRLYIFGIRERCLSTD